MKHIIYCISNFNYQEFFWILNNLSNKYDANRLYLLLDILLCKIKYQINYKEYHLFSIYLLNKKERKTILTTQNSKEYLDLFNNNNELSLFQFKNKIYNTYNKYLHRKWLLISKNNYQEFEIFLKGLSYIIAKTNSNQNKIEKIRVGDYDRTFKLYKYLLKNNLTIVEEVITQSKEFNRIHNKSVNTIDVTTFLYNNKVNILSINLNIGNNSFFDSFIKGGMTTKIDLEKGRVLYPACDTELNVYYFHPISKEKINNIIIPYYDKIIKLINNLALIKQDIKIVTWKIAITSNGPVLVTAHPDFNYYSQFYIHNDNNLGIKNKINNILEKERALDSIENQKDEELSILN